MPIFFPSDAKSSMSRMRASAWSLNWCTSGSLSLFGKNWHLLFSVVFPCCSSIHRSLIAAWFPSFETCELMQRFFRDPRDRCLISSRGSSWRSRSLGSALGIEGAGILTRRSSDANWASCECVREQKKILTDCSGSSWSSAAGFEAMPNLFPLFSLQLFSNAASKRT